MIKSQKHTLPLWTPNCKWHIKLPIIYGGWGGGGAVQKLLFDAESKNHKIPNSHYGGGGGGVSKNYFLMLSPKIIKSQIPIMVGGGGGGGRSENLTFDAKSKNHKIPKTHLTSMNSKLQMTH